MSVPALSEYVPEAVEAAWDAWWEAKGFYRGDETDSTRPKYVLMLPPPNVGFFLFLFFSLLKKESSQFDRSRELCTWATL